jgi:hypothetical protein
VVERTGQFNHPQLTGDLREQRRVLPLRSAIALSGEEFPKMVLFISQNEQRRGCRHRHENTLLMAAPVGSAAARVMFAVSNGGGVATRLMLG